MNKVVWQVIHQNFHKLYYQQYDQNQQFKYMINYNSMYSIFNFDLLQKSNDKKNLSYTQTKSFKFNRLNTRKSLNTRLSINTQTDFLSSKIYQNLYFIKGSEQNYLDIMNIEFFCKNTLIKILNPKDDRRQKIFFQTTRIITQISYELEDLWIFQEKFTSRFFVYFLKCKILPISKCCDYPIMMIFESQLNGKIFCNNEKCQKVLCQFTNKKNNYDEKTKQNMKLKKQSINNSISKKILFGKPNLSAKILQFNQQNQEKLLDHGKIYLKEIPYQFHKYKNQDTSNYKNSSFQDIKNILNDLYR